MLYNFPVIQHIDEVLEAIKPFTNFAVRRDEVRGFTTIDYVYITHETFARTQPKWELLRECRGIAFDNNSGKVISRPFHKFFNYGEQDETTWSNIKDLDWRSDVKWDGSMIRPIPVGDSYVLATRAGVTAHSIEATKYLSSIMDSAIQTFVDMGITPIYEFIGPANPHVLHYEKNRLVFLGCRHNLTGLYTDSRENARAFKISIGDLKALHLEKGVEGYVFVTGDGQHRMKVKTDEYVLMHRAKDKAATERAVLEVFFSGKWDDFYSMLPDNSRKEYLKGYIEGVQACIDKAYASIHFVINYSGPNKLNKKDYALHIMNDEYTKAASPILFQLYENLDLNIYDLINAYGLRNSGSNNGVEKMRWLVGNGNFKEEEVEASDE